MTDHTHKSLEEIVREAQALAPEQQLAFIRDACEADVSLNETALRQIVSSPDWGDLASSPEWGSCEASSYTQGERIGPYRVLRLIGEGGMGAVLFAERADEQFQQQVAIKLVRRGLLSRNLQNRLRIERQILATLDHPNISKLLDGGTTTEGTPYIVMEYVDGQPIDTYSDTHTLTIEERLRLFRTVCSAVHCAHQNLVVHRDLKPSNILVTRGGIPKLLDFGIAKHLDERHMIQTLAVTHVDSRLMTPDHASPEQVRGDPITTASDIYVLGVLLYELLTGYKPFTLKSSRLAELEQAICEQPPLPPSAVFGHLVKAPASEIEQVARDRRITPSRLRRQLRGDLDNIVLMALRKEPERRYSSVEQFSADLDRYLQGLPVLARADSWTYRTSKFVRRHFIVVSLSAAFVASLIGFAITTHMQSQRIAHERDIAAQQRSVAELQKGRAESVSSFMIELFQLSDPSEARGNEIKAREILDRGAARIRIELKNQPELQATLMETIGLVYLSLGLTADAEPLLKQSLAVRRTLHGQEHEAVLRSLTGLAEVYRDQGDWTKARQLAEEALAISRKLAGEESLATAKALRDLGMLRFSQGEVSASEKLLRQSLDIYVARVGRKDARIASLLDMLSRIEQERGNYNAAEQLQAEALEIQRASVGEQHPLYIQRLHNLAIILQSKGDLIRAEKMLREAVARYERLLGPDHPETADAMSSLASVLQSRGEFKEAYSLYDKSLQLNRKWRGARHYYVGYDLVNLGRLALRQHKPAEAERHARDALAIYRESLPDNHQYTAAALTLLGQALVEHHRPREAEEPLKEARSIWSGQFGTTSDRYATANASLGQAWVLQGRVVEAEQAFKQSYPILVATRGATAETTLQVRGWMEHLYRSQNRAKEAADYFAAVAADNALKAAPKP